MSFSPNNSTSAPGLQAAQDAMRAAESDRPATPDVARLGEYPVAPGPVSDEIRKVLALMQRNQIMVPRPGGPNGQ